MTDKAGKLKQVFYLAIRRCENHGYYAVTAEYEQQGGRRLTPSKCCGRWDLVTKFRVDPKQLLKALREEIKLGDVL